VSIKPGKVHVAFVGASLRAFSLYLPVRLGWVSQEPWRFVAETRAAVEDQQRHDPFPGYNLSDNDRAIRFWNSFYLDENTLAKGLILGSALQKEVVIVTIAAVAWVLAGLVKPKDPGRGEAS
jgi:hypothetical protein